MAAAVMHVAPPRFLRRQPTVLAEAQRVKDKENFEVEKLVKLPTAVESKRAQKKWTIGWLLVILIQSAFCLSPFVTPVVALRLRRDLVDTPNVVLLITAVPLACVGLFVFLLSALQGGDPANRKGRLVFGSVIPLAIAICILLILIVRIYRVDRRRFGVDDECAKEERSALLSVKTTGGSGGL
eukprot:GHVQ01020132.1.p1 GENE.GHVQ01020132.1~~GHVQ01020132.1.p1  ORF type:complete len:193 (-),score=20.74 GHVQ01020132.1:116-664(-)